MKPNQIIIEKAKRRKSGLNSWWALGLLTTGLTTGFALGIHQDKKMRDSALETAKQTISSQKKFIHTLAKENAAYKTYSTVAERMANSMKFYPTLTDGISALPEAEQEEAFRQAEIEDSKEKKKIDDAIKTLGIDQNDLIFLQKGLKRER
jgi:hypothetical protein